MDYEHLSKADVLFAGESFRINSVGQVVAFNSQDQLFLEEVIYNFGSEYKEIYDNRTEFTASIKCGYTDHDQLSKEDKNICRGHLEKTIDIVKPKIVFACGNTSLLMLTKKSGISRKRGRPLPYETSNGTKTIIFPTFHVYGARADLDVNPIFKQDIKNGLDEFILKAEVQPEQGIETYVVPLEHPDTPSPELLSEKIKWLKDICENKNNKKVFHHAQFDLKHLKNYDIYPCNVWDTKLMQHIVDENCPRSLFELVKKYFPNQLSGVKYKVVDSSPALRELIFLVKTDKTISIDIETTGLDFTCNKIHTVSISVRKD
jgi:uracil-DNA glycosylase family 4